MNEIPEMSSAEAARRRKAGEIPASTIMCMWRRADEKREGGEKNACLWNFVGSQKIRKKYQLG